MLLVSSSTHRHPAPRLAPPPARTRLPACLAGCACRGRPAPLPPLAPARPPVVVPACGGRLPPAGPGCGWRMSEAGRVPHQCPRIGWLLAVPDCPHRGKPPAVPDWPGRLVLSVAVWIIKHPPAGPCPLGAATTGGEPPGMRGAPNRRCSRVPHAYPRNQLVTCPAGPPSTLAGCLPHPGPGPGPCRGMQQQAAPPGGQVSSTKARGLPHAYPPQRQAHCHTRAPAPASTLPCPTNPKRNTKNHQAPTRKRKEPETHQPPNPPNSTNPTPTQQAEHPQAQQFGNTRQAPAPPTTQGTQNRRGTRGEDAGITNPNRGSAGRA